jgi:hypothetical protein
MSRTMKIERVRTYHNPFRERPAPSRPRAPVISSRPSAAGARLEVDRWMPERHSIATGDVTR